jgi:hypothetical protein
VAGSSKSFARASRKHDRSATSGETGRGDELTVVSSEYLRGEGGESLSPTVSMRIYDMGRCQYDGISTPCRVDVAAGLLGTSTVEAAAQNGRPIITHPRPPALSRHCSPRRSIRRLILRSQGLIAWVVYSKLGLLVLRKARLKLHLVWAASLVVTSIIILLM